LKSNNKKLNESGLRIFTFLKLLYDDNAEYNKVLEIFKDEIKETSKGNIQVTLNRYINTLKVFGIKIEKEKSKYKLQSSSLYEMPFSQSDLKAISLIINYINNFPESKLAGQVQIFLQNIELRMNSNDKNTLDSLINEPPYDSSFYYSTLRNQILECEKICKEGHLINIVYLKNNEKQHCKGMLKEVIYGCKTVSIEVYDTIHRTNLEIPIHNILSIEQLPNIANKMATTTTVVYKLKNRLAKTYKLKENEMTDGLNENEELIVINKDESWDKLLCRLMRYTYNCEVLTPKNFREEMIKLLNETINKYENEESDSE